MKKNDYLEYSNLDYVEVFPWNKNFETGNAEIDEQHKYLVQLLNNLANTLVTSQSVEIHEAFEKLANYANYHFETEEAIWSDYFSDDQWFSSHQLNHASFLPKVLELKDQKLELSFREIIEKVVKFLIRWLAFHIINDDKKMAIVVEAMKNGESRERAKQISERKMNGSIRILIETVLSMYDGLSSTTLELMRERNARINAEKKLKQANQKLKIQSITDQLTGIYNRRHFESLFLSKLQKAQELHKTICLILLDIDYFKLLNDTYGHSTGDQALIQVSKRLRQIAKNRGGNAFRVGGEEFALLFFDKIHDSGHEIGEFIRQEIIAMNIANKASKISDFLTISAGVVVKIPEPLQDVEHFMRISDLLLYYAKNHGRNQVVCWSPEIEAKFPEIIEESV